ncbi:hypothetical protein BFG52_11545 [Acinetobacter larvae]|uniref:RND transporter n=1 Tax=Acinetobacter larvae TaxID=1789224 RepID=A0A1B2M143_9GAMM|nr:hypothetical protein BFG52_11545 [Acinetobacter larvae]
MGCASDGQLRSSFKPVELSSLQSKQLRIDITHPNSSQSPQHWWQVWQDPQLNEILTALDDYAPNVHLAQIRLERAAALTDLKQVDRQVQASSELKMSADRYPDHDSYPEKYAGKTGSSGRLTTTIGWHLDLWGKYKALADAAALQTDAAELQLQDVRLSLQLAISNHYLQWHISEQLLQKQLEKRKILQELLNIEQQKRRAGLAKQDHVIEASLAINTIDSQLPILRRNIAQDRHAIAALLGQSTEFSDALQKPALQLKSQQAVATTLPLHWLGERPDIAALRQLIEAQARQSDAARASFYPDINLTAVLGLQSLGLDYLFREGSRTMAIGPAINLPIFEQNRLRANLRGELANYDLAVVQYNQSLVNAIQQVSDALQQFHSAQQQFVLVQQAQQQTQQLHKIAAQRLKQGLNTRQALLRTELQQLDRAIQRIQTEHAIALAQFNLTRSLGGRWVFH